MRPALRPALEKGVAIRNPRMLRVCPSPAGLMLGQANHENTRRRLSTTSTRLVQSESNKGEKRNGAKAFESSRLADQVEGLPKWPMTFWSYEYQVGEMRMVLRNAPLFSSAAHDRVESAVNNALAGKRDTELIPQCGLVGALQNVDGHDSTEQEKVDTRDRLVIANLCLPRSTIICGSKGSGKSQTLACLVENALSLKAYPNTKTGDEIEPSAGKPLGPPAALMLHYSTNREMRTTKPCQATDMCVTGKIPVKVLVSTANMNLAVNHSYEELADIYPFFQPRMLPLYLHQHQMTTERLMRLLAVEPLGSEQSTPLPHLDKTRAILSDLAWSDTGFTYAGFREKLEQQAWTEEQKDSLGLRLNFLQTLVSPKTGQASPDGPGVHPDEAWRFEPGSLTIVDLSDPALNPEAALALFSVVLSIFMEGRRDCARIVAMDDAHGILTQTTEGKKLTKQLVSVMKERIQNDTHVMIATEEPAACPELLGPSDACFIHRTLETEQVAALQEHVDSAHRAREPRDDTSGTQARQLSDHVAGLRTREALVFCPAACLEVENSQDDISSTKIPYVPTLDSGVAKVMVRKRATIGHYPEGVIGPGDIAGLYGDEFLLMHAISDNDVPDQDDIWQDDDEPDWDELGKENDIEEHNDVPEENKDPQQSDTPEKKDNSEENDILKDKDKLKQNDSSGKNDDDDWDDDDFGDDDDYDFGFF